LENNSRVRRKRRKRERLTNWREITQAWPKIRWCHHVVQSINMFFLNPHTPAFSCLKHVQSARVKNCVRVLFFPEHTLSLHCPKRGFPCLELLLRFWRFLFEPSSAVPTASILFSIRLFARGS
jgi:hypothetical protein